MAKSEKPRCLLEDVAGAQSPEEVYAAADQHQLLKDSPEHSMSLYGCIGCLGAEVTVHQPVKKSADSPDGIGIGVDKEDLCRCLNARQLVEQIDKRFADTELLARL